MHDITLTPDMILSGTILANKFPYKIDNGWTKVTYVKDDNGKLHSIILFESASNSIEVPAVMLDDGPVLRPFSVGSVALIIQFVKAAASMEATPGMMLIGADGIVKYIVGPAKVTQTIEL